MGRLKRSALGMTRLTETGFAAPRPLGDAMLPPPACETPAFYSAAGSVMLQARFARRVRSLPHCVVDTCDSLR